MSKRKIGPSSFGQKVISVLIFLVSLIGLVGAWGFSIGKQVYVALSAHIGVNITRIGLYLGVVFSVLLWFYSSLSDVGSEKSSGTSTTRASGNRKRTKKEVPTSDQGNLTKSKQNHVSQGIALPAGKLVNLQGFNQYFKAAAWTEIKEVDLEKAEEMKDIGQDFPSYFGSGEPLFHKKPSKMTTLKGLRDYIEEVDREESLLSANPWQEQILPQESLGIPIESLPLGTLPFKSRTEQEEFLAQFKTDDNSLNQETLDFVEDKQDVRQTIAEVEQQSLEVEDFVSGTGEITASDQPEIRLDQSKSEINFQEEVSFELIKGIDEDYECLETACASLDRQEQVVPETVNSAIYSKSVMHGEDLQSRTVKRVEPWMFPDFTLLDLLPQRVITQDQDTPRQLEKVLLDFGVKAKVIRVTSGPVITRYELAPAPGVKISKIVNLSDDIALALAARDVRIEAPIPGKAAIGIEVPNKLARSVPFREVLETTSFGQYPSKLKVALGKDIADQPIIADLIKMPHLLVAGATGSGKSVCITTIINSILFQATPDEVKFLLVDPKVVELSQYNGIPHLLAPVVVDPKKAASALKWIVKEMENRYELFAAAGVRDIERYNKFKAGETINCAPTLPFIVVIIDELADLMMVAAGEVEEAVCRLAQMARAAGIHLVIATQRPSVDVITGVIKANIPSRISFAVSSQIDSRTILDATGAEKLLGRGDMLYSPLGTNKALRVQGCLVTDEEVERIITHWKKLGRPEYLDPERLFSETAVKNDESNGPDDVLFLDAGLLFIRTGIASVSFLQRKLKLGYTRAARLMDMLEEQGVVGPYEGSKPRQVLLTLEEFNERFG